MDWANEITGHPVLVTGASGFIGEHLCRRLVTCEAHVHAVSRDRHSSKSKSLHWWQADLTDIPATRQVLQAVRPSFVFHLASYVAGSRTLEAVLPTFDNLRGTVHLLTAAAEMGCRRIVMASSCEEPLAFDETAFPCSPYAAAKWGGSIYGRMFHRLFQTPVVMPRIFMTYGPAQKDLQKVVPYVIGRLLRGEAPRLSSGRRLADWIYVDDVVEGLVRAAVAPGVEGCAFDLGTGVLVSVRGVVEQIAGIMDASVKPVFDQRLDRPFEQERAAGLTFLIDTLGYQPKIALKDGLRATVDWYRREMDATLPDVIRDSVAS
jgi:UDP-glucose 4-epimerase